MTLPSRAARPAGAPAYYLGRPASRWLSAARRRPAGQPGVAVTGTGGRGDGPPAVTGVPAVDPGEAYRQAIGAGLVAHRADPLNAETGKPHHRRVVSLQPAAKENQ
jgi:hypothetical protein